MFKTLAALAVAAPRLALVQGNSNNTPAAQNANGVPFTENDPPANTFNNSSTLPVVLGPGSVPPGCNVLALDKDDKNGLNGDDKGQKSSPGNPNCQPASP
jgi:hypothetical protein